MKQALLIIDAQQELIDGNEKESAVFNKEKLIKNINLVIEKAKHTDVPVIFVRDLKVSGGEGKGFQVHEKIHIPMDSVVFDKFSTNVFKGTGLLEFLRSRSIEHLVIMGCATQHSIDSAVRTATTNGLDVTLVGDGHSTINSDELSAKQIIQHHNNTLHGQDNMDHISLVRNAAEDLFNPTHTSYR